MVDYRSSLVSGVGFFFFFFSFFSGVNSPGGSPHYGGSDYSVPRTSIYQPSAAPSSFSPAANYYASPKSLAVENIKANAWYHGPISRIAAEEMVRNNGDFLIRDSSTQHGDFVLTTRWNGQPLHFVVNRRPVPGVPARSAYHFEEDAFETVADLINFYVKHRKPVTEASGAVIAAGVPCFGAAPRESQSHRQQPVALAKYGSQPLLNSAFDSCAESGPQTLERRLSVPSIAKMTAVDISIEGGQHAEAASGDGGQSITGGESVFSPVTLDSHSPAALPKAV
jgi:hypothetical protein